MIIGIPPFYNRDQNYELIYKMIKEKEVGFGTKIPITTNAKDIILNVSKFFNEFYILNFEQLLIKDPAKRLGSKGAQDIKDHPWFNDVDWKALYEKKVTTSQVASDEYSFDFFSKVVPPFRPQITNDYDVNNFDIEFTSEGKIHLTWNFSLISFCYSEAINSVTDNTDMNLIKEYQREFENFSYNPNAAGLRVSMRDSKIGRASENGANNRDSAIRESQYSMDLSIPEEKEYEGFDDVM